jgi:hypothetical protein
VAALKKQMCRSCSADEASKASQPSPLGWLALFNPAVLGALKRCLAPKDNRPLRAARGRGMNISYKRITLCFVFVVLGSTLAFARPMTGAEIGCHPYERERPLLMLRYQNHAPRAGYARRRLPNTTKDDWPAGMILGNADFMLTFRHWLSV